MLKKTLSIFLISRWLIAIFIISVAGIAATPFDKETHKTRIVMGTIINSNIGLVTVGLKEHPGQILTLSTNPKAERLSLQPGDHIIVEYSPDYIIRSIAKQG
ncbi:MAG: hypothetical protein PVG35_03210 [Desulfobacterales bacterium]